MPSDSPGQQRERYAKSGELMKHFGFSYSFISIYTKPDPDDPGRPMMPSLRVGRDRRFLISAVDDYLNNVLQPYNEAKRAGKTSVAPTTERTGKAGSRSTPDQQPCVICAWPIGGVCLVCGEEISAPRTLLTVRGNFDGAQNAVVHDACLNELDKRLHQPHVQWGLDLDA